MGGRAPKVDHVRDRFIAAIESAEKLCLAVQGSGDNSPASSRPRLHPERVRRVVELAFMGVVESCGYAGLFARLARVFRAAAPWPSVVSPPFARDRDVAYRAFAMRQPPIAACLQRGTWAPSGAVTRRTLPFQQRRLWQQVTAAQCNTASSRQHEENS